MTALLRWFLPELRGEHRVSADPASLLAALEARVARGLLAPPTPPHRNRYEVSETGLGEMTIESRSRLTDFTVGLNHIELSVHPDGGGARVDYRITWWGWLRFGLLLGSMFVVLGVVLFGALPLMPPEWTGHTSVGWGRWMALGMGLFWGVCWPFILAGAHRRPVERLWRSILDDVATNVRA